MLPICPACEAEIELDELDIDAGEIISCPDCGADLEVVQLAPLELALAPIEEGGDVWIES